MVLFKDGTLQQLCVNHLMNFIFFQIQTKRYIYMTITSKFLEAFTQIYKKQILFQVLQPLMQYLSNFISQIVVLLLLKKCIYFPNRPQFMVIFHLSLIIIHSFILKIIPLQETKLLIISLYYSKYIMLDIGLYIRTQLLFIDFS